MMKPEVPFYDSHQEITGALYRQRKLWLGQEMTDSHSLASLEHRQRVHIHVLSNVIDPDEEVPVKEHDLFVYLAARMQSKDPDVRDKGYVLAMECIVGDSVQQAAACQALLYYPPTDNKELVKLYQADEEVQPVLFNLWRDQSVRIDRAIVNAAVNSSRAELAASALRYASENFEIGRDIFNVHTDRLIEEQHRSDQNEALIEAALWGNMLRGDPDIHRKIRLAIESTTESSNQSFIRLAALSGAQDLYPIVEAWAQSQPEPGLIYLALTGRKEAAQVLLEFLQTGRESEAAAAAWNWLTGETLVMVPRMKIVSDDADKTMETESDVPVQPDYSQAESWWQENKDQWKNGARKISGCDISAQNLVDQVKHICGIYGKYYRDLLALELGRPLGVSPNAWLIKQDAVINKLATEVIPQSSDSGMVDHARAV